MCRVLFLCVALRESVCVRICVSLSLFVWLSAQPLSGSLLGSVRSLVYTIILLLLRVLLHLFITHILLIQHTHAHTYISLISLHPHPFYYTHKHTGTYLINDNVTGRRQERERARNLDTQSCVSRYLCRNAHKRPRAQDTRARSGLSRLDRIRVTLQQRMTPSTKDDSRNKKNLVHCIATVEMLWPSQVDFLSAGDTLF